MNTGYTAERASFHDEMLPKVLAELRERGYPVQELPPDGHRPDARLTDTGHYIDVKTGEPNLAIELNSIDTYRQIQSIEGYRVYIVWARPSFPGPQHWSVHTPDSAAASFNGGPRRHSGNGSLDDWYLCKGPGTPFDVFFPPTEFRLVAQ